eukprot:TRINITY_DN2088_c0_g2_i1.p1 TRINITY_DN2088_c0_g2~~TRINITY_DN2088_c0_g2_i1.p1  ORF type:complete len:338 (-),score=123.87 TRINITY_DN2088_c0_g2_i1:211-1086(-)
MNLEEKEKGRTLNDEEKLEELKENDKELMGNVENKGNIENEGEYEGDYKEQQNELIGSEQQSITENEQLNVLENKESDIELMENTSNKGNTENTSQQPTQPKPTPQNQPTPNNQIKFLFKPEDLRKDQLVMNIINCANKILKKHNLPTLLTYQILPISPTSGLLQIVENSITIYEIHKRFDNFWQYFRARKDDFSPRAVHRTFRGSVAVYSVVSFLLDVGDRHLENIMVTETAEFFHIDYGFILGEEPFWKKAVGPKAPVRITQTMKENSMDLLISIVIPYGHTSAGPEPI